jgi:hypothetical protein
VAIRDLFSKRLRRKENSGATEVFFYDYLPEKFRVQLIYILRDSLGKPAEYGGGLADECWHGLHESICREIGVFALGPSQVAFENCETWISNAEKIEHIFDLIEIAYQISSEYLTQFPKYKLEDSHIKMGPSDFSAELNQRFLENSLGYQIENGQIIRVDSKIIHDQIIKPSLFLLFDTKFSQANKEFLVAHEHLKNKKYSDAIVSAQRAFESTLKSIAHEMGVNYDRGSRVTDLIKILRSNDLFPAYLGAGFDSYVSMIKTGLPEIRNNAGGHGLSPKDQAVEDFIANYAIQMSAINIILFVEAYKARSLQSRNR